MTETIAALPILLLVEDDQTLQSMLEMALTDDGFNVVVASTGETAIAELEGDRTRFKGLVTDIRLGPGISGWEVGHRARQLVPGIPIVYMSGDSAHEWSAEGVPESVMLKKPFVLAQLVAALATLLNAASNAAAVNSAVTHEIE